QMECDMADKWAFAAGASLRAEPGAEWRYTNCNFVLLSRMIRDAAGGDAKSTQAFIERELLAPLGFEHAPLEYDSAGVPLGTIHLWASARDWARFGLLYLRDGVAESGQRLLPVGWVDSSPRLTPQSADEYGYGAGFWTQRGNSAAARTRIAAGFPADSFAAIGSQGQHTIVIPSHDLVIVKIGWAYTPHDDHVAVERLVRETIAALPSEIRAGDQVGHVERHLGPCLRGDDVRRASLPERRDAVTGVADRTLRPRRPPQYNSAPRARSPSALIRHVLINGLASGSSKLEHVGAFRLRRHRVGPAGQRATFRRRNSQEKRTGGGARFRVGVVGGLYRGSERHSEPSN